MTTRPPLAIARFLTTGTLLAAAFATAGIGAHLAGAAHTSTSTYAASVNTTASGTRSSGSSGSTSSTATQATGAGVSGSTQQAQTSTRGS